MDEYILIRIDLFKTLAKIAGWKEAETTEFIKRRWEWLQSMLEYED